MKHKSVAYFLFMFGLSCTGFIRISAADKVDNKYNVLSRMFQLVFEDMKKQEERLKVLENGTTVESCKTTTNIEQENLSGALTETQLKAIQDNIQHVKDYLDRISKGLAAEKIVRTENTNAIENNNNNIEKFVKDVKKSNAELHQTLVNLNDNNENCSKDMKAEFKHQEVKINAHTDEKFDSLIQNFTNQLNQHGRERRDEMKDVINVIKNIQDNVHHIIQVTNSNLAQGKDADQSSTHDNGHAYRAVDGNKNGNYYGSSCTHTKLEISPWWRVDLAWSYAIKRVVIKNRGDCCGERLHHLVITVSDEKDGTEETCGTFVGPGFRGVVYTITCDRPILGRYVKIQIKNGNNLSNLTLCEVEIYPA